MNKMKKKMNKKGDIPVTILVLGVVLVCILTIASFYFSIIKISKNFDVQAVKEAKLMKEKVDVYHNLGLSDQQIDSMLGIKTDSQGQRYILVQQGSISAEAYLP